MSPCLSVSMLEEHCYDKNKSAGAYIVFHPPAHMIKVWSRDHVFSHTVRSVSGKVGEIKRNCFYNSSSMLRMLIETLCYLIPQQNQDGLLFGCRIESVIKMANVVFDNRDRTDIVFLIGWPPKHRRT